jgi:hypothetical protein
LTENFHRLAKQKKWREKMSDFLRRRIHFSTVSKINNFCLTVKTTSNLDRMPLPPKVTI